MTSPLPDLDGIIAINRPRRVAVTGDGREIVFTTMFDHLGDFTDDAAEAVAAVVQLPDGRWVALDLAEFVPEAVN